jgi:hypothetical protein
MAVQAPLPLTIDIPAQAPGGSLLFCDNQAGWSARPKVKNEPIDIAFDVELGENNEVRRSRLTVASLRPEFQSQPLNGCQRIFEPFSRIFANIGRN